MADIKRLSRLLNGIQRNVDIASNSLVMLSLKLSTDGGTTSSELTKAILDRLVSLQNGSDVDATYHTHDGRYFTESEIGSSSASSGSDLVGDDDTYTNFNPTAATVKGALSGIDSALASIADEKVKVSANDTTAKYLENAIVAANGSNPTNALEISTLNDGGDEDLQIKFDQSKVDHGSIAGLADDDHSQYHNDARGDIRYYQKTEFTTASTPNAPVKLDGAGKIAAAQLPSAVMTYEGLWNASTNSPSLADGAGDAGMVYRVSVAGSQNLGSGSISFEVGDYVIYNGSIWEKADTTDSVVSVNSQTGVVTVNAINELTGDVTTSAASGSQSKVATIANAAVTGAKIASDTITNANINSAAAIAYSKLNLSGSIVNADINAAAAIAYSKLNLSNSIALGDMTANSVDENKLTASVAGAGLTGGAGSALAVGANSDGSIVVNANDIQVAHAPAVKASSEIAGEAFSASTLYAVRYGQDAETAGRMYKADKDASSVDNFHVVGLVKTSGALSAADPMPALTKMGLMTATAHGFTVGKPIWLSASGALTSTAPSAANEAVVKVGMAKDANTIDVQIQILGVN